MILDTSYIYLLEEIKQKAKLKNPKFQRIVILKTLETINKIYVLLNIENVEGVNALNENQAIEFSFNLAIIPGANGSVKSGYVRLLKKAFYSQATS